MRQLSGLTRLSFLGPLLAVGVAVAACGGTPEPVQNAISPAISVEGETQTSDVSSGASESVDTTGTASATTLAPEPDLDAILENVSYSTEILPILERSCASCHEAGQAGSESLVLSFASDAVENAEDIQLVTTATVMPPWPASHLSTTFLGDQSLEAEEIEAIANWYEQGAELDVVSDTPIVSTQGLSNLIDPEIVMTSAGGAYKGSAEIEDEYRCLIFEPGNTNQEWILGSQFIPDQTEIVHHGIISLASKELRDQAAWLDSTKPGPGWTCYGGTGLQTNEGGYTFNMSGWAPGGQPQRQPEGYAIPLNPGDFFVVQIHYHFLEDPPADLSQFTLDLASDEEIANQGGSYKSLSGSLYLGPAEIPCYVGDTHPLCERDAAVARAKSLYGEFIGGLPDYFLWNCGSDVADYANMTNGDASSTCDLPVTNPGRIVSVTGHMHELGQSIRLTINPDTPEERILLDIPDWDFEWQLGYSPVEDIIIDAGDTIRIDCSWNRERAPYQPVGYILWADGTGDEMCFSNITTAPIS